MEIYERIRLLRKECLKMTQENFGAALGVNRDVIRNIEGNRLVKPEQKEPLHKLICKEFNVNYEWLMSGGGEMLVVNEADAKADAIRQLSEVYQLDDIDKKWLDIVLSLPPAERGQLKRLALRLAEAAAELSGDMEAAEEISPVINGEGLSIKQQADLLRARADALERGNVLSTTLEKPATG